MHPNTINAMVRRAARDLADCLPSHVGTVSARNRIFERVTYGMTVTDTDRANIRRALNRYAPLRTH